MRLLPASCVLLLLGCGRGASEVSPSATASGAAAPSGSSAGAAPSSAPLSLGTVRVGEQVRTGPPCRAIGVKGEVRVLPDRDVLHDEQSHDGRREVELAKDASVTFKFAASARELTLTGPARALPCRNGDEVVLLRSGKLSATPGLGARPGAEVLVGTRFGVVRWADAQLSVVVDAKGAKIEVTTGEAWLEPAKPGRVKPELQLRPPAGRGLLDAAPSLEEALVACETRVDTAIQTFRDVVMPNPSNSVPMGQRSETNVLARRAARFACLSAAAAVDASDTAAMTRLGHAEERWRRPGKAGPPGAASAAPGASGASSR